MGRNPSYFLTRDQFRHPIRRGLGRALLHLKHHPQAVYEDEILYACTHFTGYDASIDGLPTAYLWTALNWSGCKQRLRNSIFDALLRATEDRAWWQLLELTDQYARNGDEEAMGVLRQRFGSNPRDDLLRGIRTILRRSHGDVLCFIAESVGKRILSGEIDADGSFFQRYFKQLFRQERLNEVLRPRVAANEAIGAFVRCVDQDTSMCQQERTANRHETQSMRHPSQLRKKLVGLPFDDVVSELIESRCQPSIGLLCLWSQSASKPDLLKAAAYFRDAKDEFAIKLGLSVFPFAAYPLDPQPLIDLAMESDERRSHFAYLSLHQIRHEKVRTLYERLIASQNPSRYVFGLLNHNYQPGDLSLIQQWLNDYAATYPDQPSSDDEMDMHRYGSDLYDVCRKQSVSEGTSAVYLWLFENMACKMCRCDALKALIEQGAADDATLFEATFDADAGIRRVARRARRGRIG